MYGAEFFIFLAFITRLRAKNADSRRLHADFRRLQQIKGGAELRRRKNRIYLYFIAGVNRCIFINGGRNAAGVKRPRR